FLHRRHEAQSATPDGRTGSSGTLITSDHAGTHIDALCHQAVGLQLCGGVDAQAAATTFGYRELGVDTIEPIVTRGWLIDLGGVQLDRWIGLDEVRRAADAQAVRPAAGDVVLVRTGNGVNWADEARYLRGAGLKGEVSQWLADVGVRAVGADNMAWDWIGGPGPRPGPSLPRHPPPLGPGGPFACGALFFAGLSAA